MSDIVLAGGILFAFSFLLALVLTGLVRKVALRRDFTSKPAANKLHQKIVPLGGGLAIFAATLIPLCLAVAGAWILCSPAGKTTYPAWLPESLGVHLEGMLSVAGRLGLIGLGGLVIVLIGFRDDIKPLSPRRKLLFTAMAAAVPVLGGIRVSVFIEEPIVGGLLTILWIVGLTHVFNLLDNMDGLSSSVASVLSLVFLVVAIQTGQLFVAAFLVVLIGALLGFLRFNFPPAKIMMGDSGSLFIGYILAIITVVFSFFDPEFSLPSGEFNRFFVVIVPLLIFAVPLFDTISVIFIRIREKRPVFVGDKCHFSHRLLKLGMSVRGSLLTVCLATFCTGIPAVLLYRPEGSALSELLTAIVLAAQAAGIIAIIVLLETAAAKKTNGDNP